MNLIPYPYRGEQDLAALQDLLRAGILANPRLTYAHPGDIEWWFYYNPVKPPPEETVLLWRTPSGELAAWTLYDLRNRAYDLYVHPAYRSESLFDEFIGWFEAEALRHPSLAEAITCDWCMRSDEMFVASLVRAGYSQDPFLVLFERDISTPISAPTLPQGFRFLEAMDEAHLSSRAQAHYSAFTWEGHPSRMTPMFYRRFITAPGYDPTLDIAIVNEEDMVVAFAMAWADLTLQRSEFEPVGTHRAYHRRGLGRAVLLEGMRRLQARGIKTANVATGFHDDGNRAFYPTAGFEIVGYNDNYVKPFKTDGQ